MHLSFFGCNLPPRDLRNYMLISGMGEVYRENEVLGERIEFVQY